MNDQRFALYTEIRRAHAGLPRRRWRIAWLLGIGVLVNYFDRVNLSVSHDSLIAAFGISDVVFGYLSSAYNWTYALCQLPIGVILDKFGVRRVGRIGTFLWSAASFAAAVTPTLSAFFGARFLLGVGEAPTFPANAKAIGLWFPPARAQLGHLALRCRGQVRLGHRSSADRHRSDPRRMALELRLHRRHQLRLLSSLLARLPRSRRKIPI